MGNFTARRRKSGIEEWFTDRQQQTEAFPTFYSQAVRHPWQKGDTKGVISEVQLLGPILVLKLQSLWRRLTVRGSSYLDPTRAPPIPTRLRSGCGREQPEAQSRDLPQSRCANNRSQSSFQTGEKSGPKSGPKKGLDLGPTPMLSNRICTGGPHSGPKLGPLFGPTFGPSSAHRIRAKNQSPPPQSQTGQHQGTPSLDNAWKVDPPPGTGPRTRGRRG